VTIFGGTKDKSGSIKDGFFVACTRCGWHTLVKLVAKKREMIFYCGRCKNTHRESLV
jgi:DNA-directed RNA polymerase subunit RPC12/RpoP